MKRGFSGNIALSDSEIVTRMLDMTSTIQAGFAQRLRELRKQKGLSQTELGKLAELHYTHIGRFERGTSLPGSDTLKRLASALEVTSDYLLEGTPNDAAKARFEDRELLALFQEIEQLPAEDKAVIKIFLDAFLTKKQIKLLAK